MKLFLVGINGKMGKMISSIAESTDGIEIVGGIDVVKGGAYPVFEKAKDVNVDFDCIIDFSRPSTLDEVISLARAKKSPVVIATTGLTPEQVEKINDLATELPVFRSANMSLGVNVVESVLPALASALKGFDIELIEAHHNQKLDAPSGTAKQMLEAIEKGLDYKPEYVNGREGDCKRKPGDIGVHAIRGGSIVGEHTVIFAGEDEIIEIKHTALSRKIFAVGSIKAAGFLIGKTHGLYNMTDYLESK